MEGLFRSYLALLDTLREKLEQLSDLARQKNAAVQNDDLLAVDNIMKQEQAIALTFRGLEQKQDKHLRDMGLRDVPLSKLADRYPAELRTEAKKTIEALRNQYQIYRASAEVARNTLESTLYQIDRFLNSVGAAPTTGPGYTPVQAEPPQAMKTDFRA